jgi:hypothetical protein
MNNQTPFTVLDRDGGTNFTVTGVVAYADTVACLIPYPLPSDLWEQLRCSRAATVISRRARYYGLKNQLYKPIRIQQPTRDTIVVLAGLRNCIIGRIDIAVDFICGSVEDAYAAQRYLDRSLLQKGHGKRVKHPHDHTVYWSRCRTTSRNVALYGDKPSKTGNGPCAHLELRFSSAAACRSINLFVPSQLLADIDVMELLKRQTKLTCVNERALERLAEAAARRHLRHRVAPRRRAAARASTYDQFTTVDGLKLRTAGLVRRAFAREGLPGINAQELVERRPNMRSILTPVDWEQVIPPPEWALLQAG